MPKLCLMRSDADLIAFVINSAEALMKSRIGDMRPGQIGKRDARECWVICGSSHDSHKRLWTFIYGPGSASSGLANAIVFDPLGETKESEVVEILNAKET